MKKASKTMYNDTKSGALSELAGRGLLARVGTSSLCMQAFCREFELEATNE
jgi:hypothetical protein